jgi:hypothetical protein
MKCTNEVKRCPNGDFVTQDPDNGCQYYECPGNQPIRKPTASPIGTTMHSKYASHVACSKELFRCSDGQFVGQDPNNNCEWYPCTINHTAIKIQQKSDYQSVGTLPGCSNELSPCADGSFVGKDPDNGCQFFQCPPSDEGLEQRSSMAGAMTEAMDAHAGDVTRHQKKIEQPSEAGGQIHRKKRNSSRRAT